MEVNGRKVKPSTHSLNITLFLTVNLCSNIFA